jgi:hypothetical protein
MKQQAPRTMEFSIHDFATTLPKLYDTCVRIGKLIRSPIHSGEENVCSSRGDSIFSALPTFKATTKPEKCHLFSGPCSGTENWQSSAPVIRFLGLTVGQRIRSPLLLLFECGCIGVLDGPSVRNGWKNTCHRITLNHNRHQRHGPHPAAYPRWVSGAWGARMSPTRGSPS